MARQKEPNEFTPVKFSNEEFANVIGEALGIADNIEDSDLRSILEDEDGDRPVPSVQKAIENDGIQDYGGATTARVLDIALTNGQDFRVLVRDVTGTKITGGD